MRAFRARVELYRRRKRDAAAREALKLRLYRVDERQAIVRDGPHDAVVLYPLLYAAPHSSQLTAASSCHRSTRTHTTIIMGTALTTDGSLVACVAHTAGSCPSSASERAGSGATLDSSGYAKQQRH